MIKSLAEIATYCTPVVGALYDLNVSYELNRTWQEIAAAIEDLKNETPAPTSRKTSSTHTKSGAGNTGTLELLGKLDKSNQIRATYYFAKENKAYQLGFLGSTTRVTIWVAARFLFPALNPQIFLAVGGLDLLSFALSSLRLYREGPLFFRAGGKTVDWKTSSSLVPRRIFGNTYGIKHFTSTISQEELLRRELQIQGHELQSSTNYLEDVRGKLRDEKLKNSRSTSNLPNLNNSINNSSAIELSQMATIANERVKGLEEANKHLQELCNSKSSEEAHLRNQLQREQDKRAELSSKLQILEASSGNEQVRALQEKVARLEEELKKAFQNSASSFISASQTQSAAGAGSRRPLPSQPAVGSPPPPPKPTGGPPPPPAGGLPPPPVPKPLQSQKLLQKSQSKETSGIKAATSMSRSFGAPSARELLSSKSRLRSTTIASEDRNFPWKPEKWPSTDFGQRTGSPPADSRKKENEITEVFNKLKSISLSLSRCDDLLLKSDNNSAKPISGEELKKLWEELKQQGLITADDDDWDNIPAIDGDTQPFADEQLEASFIISAAAAPSIDIARERLKKKIVQLENGKKYCTALSEELGKKLSREPIDLKTFTDKFLDELKKHSQEISP